MIKAIIQHGSFGNPNENWFPWLKQELIRVGIKAFTPQMPIGEKQNLTNWLKEYSKLFPEIDKETILIGHSIATAFFMSLVEEINTNIKGMFLVSGFLHDINLSKYDKVNETFYKKEFDWKRIKRLGGKIYFYSSDNDPYVPFEFQKEFADKLGIQQIVINNAGHFNTSSGYSAFPVLLNDIRLLISSGM